MVTDTTALTEESSVKLVNVTIEEKVKVENDNKIVIKVYKRRWLMLGLFILYSALVASQWIIYSIISNIIQRYYSVSSLAVDCTSMIFMISYVVFIFPITYLSERIGLRWTVIIGNILCCLGAWIKIFSVSPNRFIVTLFGQFLVALSVVIMIPLPGRVAANWFPSKERSTATSIGVFGPQIGVSISFLLPPVIVKNHENIEDIGNDLSHMFWFIAIATALCLVITILFFQDEPHFSPSETRALQKAKYIENKESFSKPMKRLFTNRSFMILCNSFGLNIAILNTISTLLNQLFLLHFKNGEEDAGRIGLSIMLTGMFGSITIGIIIDRTHKFKETAIAVYFFTLCGQILFTAAMFLELKWMVYVASVFLGFFISGYLALGYELSAEYTYPESETIAAGVLNISNNVYGIMLVIILEKVLEHYGDVPVHVIFSIGLLLGLIMTILTKDEQRRQDARKTAAIYQNVSQDDNHKIAHSVA